MWTKHGLFLAIAIFFIFSYPVISRTWNLNYTIGWYGRDFWTFLIPLWFFLVFLTYRKISLQGGEISNYIFWSHILLALIPSFYFNHPFLKTFDEGASAEDAINKMVRVYQVFLLYSVVQVSLYLFLLFKLFRK
jgi:hypothetical protein